MLFKDKIAIVNQMNEQELLARKRELLTALNERETWLRYMIPEDSQERRDMNSEIAQINYRLHYDFGYWNK